MKTAVAYIRVSTQKQGRSGLGLEAQQASITRFAAAEGYDLVQTFVEIETGKGADALDKRPQLALALAAAQKAKGHIIVAKLDRLSRNVHFISGLMQAKVAFKVVDLPHADNFQLHLFAALAEQEREMISARTIAALQAAKARGVVLGNAAQAQANADKAKVFAIDLAGIVGPIIDLPLRQIAAHLNDAGITTPTGGQWHPQSTARLVQRLKGVPA
jgi:DNA invertase Pin-like site-specific DNA recombinase